MDKEQLEQMLREMNRLVALLNTVNRELERISKIIQTEGAENAN